MKKIFILFVLGFILSLALVLFVGSVGAQEAKIIDGKKVSMEYTLRLSDGKIVDSNVGKNPLVYVQGEHKIIPGLERQLLGLKVGDERKIEVSPKEGYGERQPKISQEVPKTQINPQALKVGEELVSYDSYGRPIRAKIKEIKTDVAVLEMDLNHPLAGERLYFDVKILKVED